MHCCKLSFLSITTLILFLLHIFIFFLELYYFLIALNIQYQTHPLLISHQFGNPRIILLFSLSLLFYLKSAQFYHQSNHFLRFYYHLGFHLLSDHLFQSNQELIFHLNLLLFYFFSQELVFLVRLHHSNLLALYNKTLLRFPLFLVL